MRINVKEFHAGLYSRAAVAAYDNYSTAIVPTAGVTVVERRAPMHEDVPQWGAFMPTHRGRCRIEPVTR